MTMHSTTLRRTSLGLALMLAALLVAACDDDDDDVSSASATETAMAATPAGDETPAAGGDPGTGGPNESGGEPIFWRTLDDFASLGTDEPYKIVFRVTNGYAEDTLPVTAVHEDGAEQEFEATRVEPDEGEEPGVYYTVSLELPEQGQWTITIVADEASAAIDVTA